MKEMGYFKNRKAQISGNELSEEVLQIKTDDIRPNRAQPRAGFEPNSIIKLADSIRRYGILQPLTVRKAEEDDSYDYELIAGERRLRAARMLGYLTVPCIIKETDDKTAAELAIIENLLREDLNMFEEAYGYKKLIENHNLTQEEVAKRMSVSQSAIANKLRLLRLDYEDQRIILDTGLTERHARALLRVEDPRLRRDALSFIVENRLNVSMSEEYIEELRKRERQIGRKNNDFAVNDAHNMFFASPGNDFDNKQVGGLGGASDGVQGENKNVTLTGNANDLLCGDGNYVLPEILSGVSDCDSNHGENVPSSGKQMRSPCDIGQRVVLTCRIDDVVSSIRRRVDKWVDSGKNADISVKNSSEVVEILIKLQK